MALLQIPERITVDVGHGVKAKVSKMAKESIKVERSENKKTTYEE